MTRQERRLARALARARLQMIDDFTRRARREARRTSRGVAHSVLRSCYFFVPARALMSTCRCRLATLSFTAYEHFGVPAYNGRAQAARDTGYRSLEHRIAL